jgi:hypothetical protein
LHVLRKAAVTQGSGDAVGGDVRRELRSIRKIKRLVLRKCDERLGVGGERAAQDGFVDEVDAKARGVFPVDVAHIVAELVLLLIAEDRKRRDGCNELIVPKGFQAGNRVRCGTEWERQSEAEIGIASLREMQSAVAKDKGAEPIGTEGKLIAKDEV